MSQFGTKLNFSRRLSFILVRQTKLKWTPSEVQTSAIQKKFLQICTIQLSRSRFLTTISSLHNVRVDTVSTKLPSYLCLENGCRDSGVHEGLFMNWKDILALPQAHNSTNFTQNLSPPAQSNPQKWGNQIRPEQSEFTEEYKHTFSPQNTEGS